MMGATGIIAWLSIRYQVYELPLFQVATLAIVALGLAMFIAQRSLRDRLFRGRWRLVGIARLAISLLSLAVCWLVVGSVTPLFQLCGIIALLAAALIIVCAAFALTAAATCHTTLRASAAGLRLIAAGIRRMQ